MPSFSPLDRGGVRVRLDESEAPVFRRLVEEMRELLLMSEDIPEEPIRDRLFPAAYQDPDQEKSYRELVHSDLLQGKLAALDLIAGAIGRHGVVDIEVPAGEVDAWLTALTDIRLAIGTRLDVDEEKMSAEADLNDPEAPALGVLHWLGWMQELLLDAIDEGDTR